MLTQEAIEFFGSQVKVAAALGISSAAVSQWGESPPMLRQYQLERISGAALKAGGIEEKAAA